MCAVYRPNTVSNAIVKRWLQPFISSNTEVEDGTGFGTPTNENVDKTMEIFELDRYMST